MRTRDTRAADGNPTAEATDLWAQRVAEALQG